MNEPSLPEIPRWNDDDPLVARCRESGRPVVSVRPAPRLEIVLGRGSRPELELNLPAVLADGIPVRRRPGGGCAVVLDPGNLLVTVVLPVPGIGGVRAWFDRVTDWMVECLAACGVSGVARRGVSDLALADRKVSGSALHRSRGIVHYAATLLVEPRVDLVERWLAHPPREPAWRRGRPHREFMGGLAGRVSPAALAALPGTLEAALLARAREAPLTS